MDYIKIKTSNNTIPEIKVINVDKTPSPTLQPTESLKRLKINKASSVAASPSVFEKCSDLKEDYSTPFK